MQDRGHLEFLDKVELISNDCVLCRNRTSDDINIRKDRENADVAVMECAR